MPNSLKCHVKAVKSLLSKTEMSYLLVFTRTEHLQKVSSPKIGGILEPKNIWKMTKSAVVLSQSQMQPTIFGCHSVCLFVVCSFWRTLLNDWLRCSCDILHLLWTLQLFSFEQYCWNVSSASHTLSSVPHALCSNPFHYFLLVDVTLLIAYPPLQVLNKHSLVF